MSVDGRSPGTRAAGRRPTSRGRCAVPPDRGRQRRPAAGGDGRRAGLGELAAVGRVRGPVGHARSRSASARCDIDRGPAALGQRRPDGVLLLRRRPGDPARARAGRAARPPRGRDPGARRRSAGWSCPRCCTSPSTPAAGGARLGHRHGDRHRVRARRARALGPACPPQRARVPADAGDRRRHRRHRRDRGLLLGRHRARRARGAGGVLVADRVCSRRVRVWRGPAYLVVGLVLWVAMLESGVHPTIAGVALGLLSPRCTRRGAPTSSAPRALDRGVPPRPVARAGALGDARGARAVSPNERLQELLHPWTSYVDRAAVRARQRGRAAAAGTRSARADLADHHRRRRRPGRRARRSASRWRRLARASGSGSARCRAA